MAMRGDAEELEGKRLGGCCDIEYEVLLPSQGRYRDFGRVLSAICELQDEVVRHTHVAA